MCAVPWVLGGFLSLLRLDLCWPAPLCHMIAEGEEEEEDGRHCFEPWNSRDDEWLHNVAVLEDLPRLTHLELNMQDRKVEHPYWRGLAHVTQLKSLCLTSLDFNYLGGVAHLSSCRQLTCLKADGDGDGYASVHLKQVGSAQAGLLCARQCL